jgi:uncharacterized membrane protein YhaH (DUF805 family)
MSYEYFLEAYRKYAQFTGRARRSEYWFFYLFFIIGLFVIMLISATINRSLGLILCGGYFLGSIIPFFALSVRRLHDTDNSGAMILIRLIPIIGGIWLLVLNCTDSVHGTNKYGPNPKGIGNLDIDKSDDLIQQIGQT